MHNMYLPVCRKCVFDSCIYLVIDIMHARCSSLEPSSGNVQKHKSAATDLHGQLIRACCGYGLRRCSDLDFATTCDA